MPRFPERPYDAVADYYRDYCGRVRAAQDTVDAGALRRAAALVDATVQARGQLFACGNGGSAAISDHLVCDFEKGIGTDTHLKPPVTSLAANAALITAIANDIAYAEVFAFQLDRMAKPGDLLITVSSSGSSPNIVRALETARAMGVRSIALCGFAGGPSLTLADVALHVASDNYGVVEDVHQSLMHVLAQFVRQAHMTAEAVTDRTF